MFRESVEKLLNEALEKREDLFLIDLSISSSNAICVILDGDNGVSLNDCIEVSRQIEHNLDREEQDFSLQVTSAGLSEPLSIKRQYQKNIGRKLSVKLHDVSKPIEGELTAVDDLKITLEFKAREPKPVGKGKVTVQKKEEIAFDAIKEAKVMVIF
ncbi:ribosome maturation factor RimP [Pustulibacterium marinum]|uniref:Ribosome maturation factor RimP n=1 Tax=Pustulibacterium marinum TaxID=1224947 RepID=A0A1I7HAM6_9FLAO|nr:ribosome assembly cofactor RimP [Pustulibacterium marinum]SFU57764.1 ribosome maturation factor RimP [Pustulibacterium marinum]